MSKNLNKMAEESFEIVCKATHTPFCPNEDSDGHFYFV